MVLSSLGRTAIVAARLVAATINAVMLRLASSRIKLFVTIRTRAAAKGASSRRLEQSAEPAQGSVILEKYAPGKMPCVRQIRQRQTAKTVATAPSNCSVRAANNFLDGTNCGGGGKCANGQCKGSSTVKEVGSWINDNKPLVIGVCSAVGGIILLMLLGCIVRRCRRPKRQRKRRNHSPPVQAWGPPPPMPPPMRSRGHTGGWGGAPHGPGPYWQQPPHMPPPPPTYYQPSVRYA
ncbi:hypothetical protein MMC16_002033 [Acarospora aff. strigata]|nr:hypothetical protein [Acarospora aff. strigata]